MPRKHKRRQPGPADAPKAAGDDYGRPAGPDLEEFNILLAIAISLIFCVAAVAMSTNNFISIWTLPPTNRVTPIFAARVLLFVELVALVFLWILATLKELRLWKRYLEQPLPRESVRGALICLSVYLGISVAFPHQIVFLTGFMGVSFLLNYWTQWLSNDHFQRALTLTRQLPDLKDTRRRILAVMEKYWLEKPQLARNATMMFFILVSFALALAGSVQGEPSRSLWQLIAYAMLISTILVGEVVISWWRHERDADIRAILARS